MKGHHSVVTTPAPQAERTGHPVDALLLGGILLLAVALFLLPTPTRQPVTASQGVSSAVDQTSTGSSQELAGGLSASGANRMVLGTARENWTVTTDESMGGTSEVDLVMADGLLRLRGELQGGAAFPWAGGTVAVGESLSSTRDLSDHRTLRFRLRGDPRQVAVMVISGGSRHMPPTQFVTAQTQWTDVVLPLDGFLGADLSAVHGIAFSAVQTPGSFAFEIDDVELH